jgi:outer membrane protein TolC
LIVGSRSDVYDFELDVSKQTLSGANAGLRVGANRSRLRPGVFPLNPRSESTVDLSWTQPLLRGRGVDVNSVPIVLAFLDTQRSYFQLKGSLQNLVQGVIQGYWDLVQARLDLWVLRQQIRQTEAANSLAETRLEVGVTNIGDASQTRTSLANFRASVIAAETALLDRAASLQAILGLPPSGEFTVVPTTPPLIEDREFDWEALVGLAEANRPDLVELQLILDADYQRILLSRNRAQPQLDATALYRWNGLEGEMPIGDRLGSRPAEYQDWALAVNFSVPLTLRADRAALRRNELLLASDRTNLQQRLLEVSHSLAANLRTLDLLYAQYKAYKLAREASVRNLELQFGSYQVGNVLFIDLLLAITNWGTAVTNEARSITQFNTALASLELQTGTILETHGIRLFEERYRALGPLGVLGKGREYPQNMRPSPNTEKYIRGDRPAEEAFDLTAPIKFSLDPPERLPPVSEPN